MVTNSPSGGMFELIIILKVYLKHTSHTLLSHFMTNLLKKSGSQISGQSYKQFTLVNYDSRVVPDLKTPHITTLGS